MFSRETIPDEEWFAQTAWLGRQAAGTIRMGALTLRGGPFVARAALGAVLAVLTACASSGESFDRDVEAFYAAFEAAVRSAARELGPDEREQLLDIMPRAEFEGATADVLAVIATRPALGPMVRRIERFLATEPSGSVRLEIRSSQGDRRLWHILLDEINRELGRRSQ